MVSLRNLSLRRKLPLLVCGLTGGALLLAGGLAYFEVRRAALAAAEARLASIVAEIVTMNVSLQTERDALEQRVTASPYVRAAIEGWMVDTLRLNELFDSLRSAAEFSMPISILRTDRSVAFVSGTLSDATADPDPVAPLSTQREYGPFRTVDGRVLYWLTIPVSDSADEPMGWVAQRRSIGGLPSGGMITTLLGDQVRVLIGQRKDDQWLDVTGKLVEVTSSGIGFGDSYRLFRPTGDESLAVAQPLPPGSWIVQADMPMVRVMARPRAFRNVALVVGSMLTFVAVFVAWLVSGRLTRPITALVSAADAMSAGDYERRVPPHAADDELGRLATTFNTMAERVASADVAMRLRLEELLALASRLEDANVAAEKAREEALAANRVKSEFLATMSHEIRTPISVVLSYVDLLKAGVPDRPTPRQRDYLRQIDQSSQLLLWLLNDLLDYSKLESAQIRIALGSGSAREVIRAAVTALEPSAMQKHISVTSRPCDATFHADQHRVHQIVLNLVSNAIKYTPPGGVVVVGCALVEAGPPDIESSSDPWVRIDVKDTGIGIAPEELSRIFEPFVRGADETVGRHNGAGLGLAISQRLAAMMSGAITVTSERGEGSEFTLWLPAAPAAMHEEDVVVQATELLR